MAKRYLNMRITLNQDKVDNWLLMIPTDKVSSDAKIVYQVLKKMQWYDGSCGTDANSWKKITGIDYARVKECLLELERFGLVEIYLSPQNIRDNKRTYKVYLLDHFLMKKSYPTMDCPHDGCSLPNPMDDDHYLRNRHAAKRIKSFREAVEGNTQHGSIELD